MSRLPLQTLPTFKLLAELQNMRGVAERLHLTHSAVSQQLKLLEDRVGAPLFERRGRGLVLNAAGAALKEAVAPALERLDEGLRRAQLIARGQAQTLRITLLPSFAQRWLLPRMPAWRARHPEISLELHTSQQIVDLAREGYHVALRQGSGHWRGLTSERLIDSPLIAVGSPAAAQRLRGNPTASLAQEPLLGPTDLWERWFALDCCVTDIRPVAVFSDAGMLLQAVEQDMGIGLAREVFAADAMRAGRLVRLSPLALPDESAYAFWIAHPPELADWAPLVALRQWLHAEMARSLQGLPAVMTTVPATGTAAAPRKGSRTRARSA